jgi:nucleotide-binding universal stress UspA family protein
LVPPRAVAAVDDVGMPEVIRDPVPRGNPAPLPWSKPGLLVGFDGSASASAALATAVRMAPSLGRPGHLVVVWDYPTLIYGDVYSPEIDARPEEDAEEIRSVAVAEALGGDVPEWFTSSTQRGRPARTLIELSKQAEIVVVGSRGHGGFTGLLLGSVSSALVSHAKCSVLIVR